MYEISCFTRLDYRSDPEKIEYIVGLGKGDVLLYQETTNLLFQTQINKKTLETMKNQEGSIIGLAYSRNLLVWATSKQIRVRYYRNILEQGQNICSIEVPHVTKQKQDLFPD
jgi:hypothetical protein